MSILKRTNLTIAFMLTAVLVQPAAHAQTFNANSPASSGYKLTFEDDFTSLGTIDVNATGKSGYKWYTKQFFGYKTTRASDLSVRNGVLTINGPTGCNASLETAAPASNADGYIGTTFAGGGYFEASIAFDKSLIDINHGFPAFWSMAIEHMALKGRSQWEGQIPGFEHFIEVDFFEANTFVKAGADTYSGAVHDWYGTWTMSKGFPEVMNPNYIIEVPHGTDFSKFHRYGTLIVPASKRNNWCGLIQCYFDGMPTSDVITWHSGTARSAPPPSGDQRFAIADNAHLNLLLGCGAGDKMRVQYVRVWQRRDAPPISP